MPGILHPVTLPASYVARELGYPLYQVSSSSELDGSFAHVQDLSEEDEAEKDEELSTNDWPWDELHTQMLVLYSSLGRENFYPSMMES
ncbi:hypothetical protein DFH09DRAFT_1310971 [Mycena vulgaris]|nr:hypothetical protein DFH09DRAFT_1310971 [Mycena vulgaris]